MAELSKEDIEDKIVEGAIHCLVTVQVVGKPAEHVEESLDKYVDMIEKEEILDVLSINREPAEQIEDDEQDFFSAFAEAEMLVPNLEALTQIAFNLSPASIEIIEPQEFSFPARDLQNWLNDMLSMIHSISSSLRGERQRAAHLNNALSSTIRNFITVLLTSGDKPTDTLQRMTGLTEEPLSRVLEKMQEEDLIRKAGDKWTLK